jgi:hypothetical protein
MQESGLLKISLLISILGIFLLLLISLLIQPKPVNSYSELKLNTYVKTTSNITSIRSSGDFSIIRLANNITATCNCKFNPNQTIEVEGKVTEYQGSLQIESERIQTDRIGFGS